MVRVGVLAALLVACGSNTTDGSEAARYRADRARGAVVATVDDAQIGVDDVADVVRGTGLAPQKALERLVSEQLLFAHAERRGYGRDKALERELKRARARALLAEVIEREIAPESIPEKDVEARFEALKGTLAQKETRKVSRLAWRRPSQEVDALARALAQQAHQRLSALPLEALRDGLSEIQAEAKEHGVDLHLEHNDVVVGTPGLDAAYARALEAMKAPGLVPEVIETPRAYFVVVVNEVLSAREAVLAEHEEKIREALATERRAARLNQLIEELTKKTKITYDEAAIAQALADDSLLGSLP